MAKRQTNVTKSDKVTPLCEVISIPAGSLPKNVVVELPQSDGSRALARYRGMPPGLAVGDFVELGRRGVDGIYRIIDADGPTINKAGYPFDIWTVDLVDPSADFTTVAAAITAASAGDVILVGPGTYTENITVNKSLTIIGFENTLTIIKSTTANTTVVDITAATVTLKNIRIEHGATTGTNNIVKTNSSSTKLDNCVLYTQAAATANRGIYIVAGAIEIISTIIRIAGGTTKTGILAETASSVTLMLQGEIDTTGGTDINLNAALTFARVIGVLTVGNFNTAGGGVIYGFFVNYTGDIYQVQGTVFLQTDGVIDFDERSSDPSTPASNHWRLYSKSDGFYQIEDTGRKVKLVQICPNLLYNSLTYGETWQRILTQEDIADDTRVAGVWTFLHNGQAPDVSRDGSDAGQNSTFHLQIEFDSASSQCGIVHFFSAADTAKMRGGVHSLSLDAWGTNVSNIRATIVYWTGTADSPTSDIVGTWATGNPTLATDWSYASTPSSSQAITSTRTRYNILENVTIPTTANNVAVFIWTPDNEASTDILNIGRVKLEESEICTAFASGGESVELETTQRFFFVPDVGAAGGTENFSYGFRLGTTQIIYSLSFPTTMFKIPTLSHNITAWDNAGALGGTDVAAFNFVSGAWITITGSLTIAINRPSKNQSGVVITAGTSFSGAAGDNVGVGFGDGVQVIFDAGL